jgi:hypothetical protein
MKDRQILRPTMIGLRNALVLLPALLMATAWSQSESQGTSLGDLARKTRAQKTSKDHVAAKKVLDEENAQSAKWQKRSASFLVTVPPAQLTISIPVPNKTVDFGAEVPIGNSNIYIPFGETSWSPSFDTAAQEFLSMLLNRSHFRCSALKVGAVEDTTIDRQRAALLHFSFVSHDIPHDGVALFVSAPEQVLSVGCMYRTVDWERAQPICEDVINSAEVQIPTGNYTVLKKTW